MRFILVGPIPHDPLLIDVDQHDTDFKAKERRPDERPTKRQNIQLH